MSFLFYLWVLFGINSWIWILVLISVCKSIDSVYANWSGFFIGFAYWPCYCDWVIQDCTNPKSKVGMWETFWVLIFVWISGSSLQNPNYPTHKFRVTEYPSPIYMPPLASTTASAALPGSLARNKVPWHHQPLLLYSQPLCFDLEWITGCAMLPYIDSKVHASYLRVKSSSHHAMVWGLIRHGWPSVLCSNSGSSGLKICFTSLEIYYKIMEYIGTYLQIHYYNKSHLDGLATR